MATKHTCNNGNGPVFGRKTIGCIRCEQLLAGFPAVKWNTTRRDSDAQRLAEIRAHDCKRSHCGVVCTAFDY